MRIVHTDTDDLGNPLRGGQPVRTYEVNSRLAADHEIRVLTATYPRCARRVARGALEYRRLGFGVPFLGLSYHMSYLAALGCAVRRLPHDLVVEEFTPPVGFCLLPLWTRKPVISIVQWFFFRDWEKRYRLPFERVMRAIPQRVGYQDFIVQTDAMGDYFRDLVPTARVWKIPCGIGNEAFLDASQDGQYVLFMGRLDVHHKGLDCLLEAWTRLCAQSLAIPLWIAGAGPAEKDLRAEVEKRGLQDSIRFVGRIEGQKKAKLLQECRFLIMPSRQETFGIVALEAMAAGKPVLAFDIDHLNELLSPKWGALVRPGDVEGLAAEAARLWQDAARCRFLGAAGREAARRYRWCEIAKAQDAVYREVHARVRER
ncbi:MAG: glycosyltransferase family 4 protein [Betaproteobacteria bacterium]|nr:glycosyltransferase family 4 protein [Betaproteobacteria bacterium]